MPTLTSAAGPNGARDGGEPPASRCVRPPLIADDKPGEIADPTSRADRLPKPAAFASMAICSPRRISAVFYMEGFHSKCSTVNGNPKIALDSVTGQTRAPGMYYQMGSQ